MSEVAKMDPLVGNLLSLLLQNDETKQLAEELTSNFANVTRDSNKAKSLVEKCFDIANKVLLITQTSQALKPIGEGLYQALKIYAATNNIEIP